MNRHSYLSGYIRPPFVQLVNVGEIWRDPDGKEFEVFGIYPASDPNGEWAEVWFARGGGDIFLHDMLKTWTRLK